ncbi:MAG: DUF4175 domain-containing protein [Paludisphaera borealis]|uniref:DUF4175 domain-containing protein n=1 Tax=Paludisphaera borealis TaxID=1387353 RepID=UPI0028510C34|nr:DUF4175 domain-containing protein [Paludisphaera borealis]MDR3617745.1 DUF4175 domain-containing protein [Paludisphaera borealis]
MTSPSTHASRVDSRGESAGRPAPAFRRLVFGLALATLAAVPSGSARAQDAKAAADGVFDEEKKDDAKKADAAKSNPPDKAPAVSDRDTIGFTQDNVAAQMNELEERMFRLSEALRSLEPENASRLRLALKFSREELILQQMKETRKLLTDTQLSKAETEVREMLAKLDHLRRLLLAEDLDFQMKLARLRQMRETMGQLERIIHEERRELAWSRSADERQADLTALVAKRTSVEALVRDQKGVIEETRAAAAKGAAAAESRDAVAKKEAEIQKKAAELAADPAFAPLQPPHLKEADGPLADVQAHLKTTNSGAAVASEELALAGFQKELDRLAGRIGEVEKAIAKPEFLKFEKDQTKNRASADTLATVSARLGDKGVALQKDLIRASGAMQEAEKELDRTAAKPAATDQREALKHLVKASDGLGKGIESLLVELRSELQTRILAELTEMHEIQLSIRETTESQAARAAQKSRTALILIAGLSQKEAELADRIDQLRALTEETEFGIALPTSLRVIGREMTKVQGWLKEGDATEHTVVMEKRIEEDLLALAEAMRRLPPSTPPKPNAPLPTEPRARERELNRLIAELKMIRLLQSRLNDDTIEADHGRPKEQVLTPPLKRLIEALKSSQDEIHETLAKLSKRYEGGGEDEAGADAPGEADQAKPTDP